MMLEMTRNVVMYIGDVGLKDSAGSNLSENLLPVKS